MTHMCKRITKEDKKIVAAYTVMQATRGTAITTPRTMQRVSATTTVKAVVGRRESTTGRATGRRIMASTTARAMGRRSRASTAARATRITTNSYNYGKGKGMDSTQGNRYVKPSRARRFLSRKDKQDAFLDLPEEERLDIMFGVIL